MGGRIHWADLFTLHTRATCDLTNPSLNPKIMIGFRAAKPVAPGASSWKPRLTPQPHSAQSQGLGFRV